MAAFIVSQINGEMRKTARQSVHKALSSRLMNKALNVQVSDTTKAEQRYQAR